MQPEAYVLLAFDLDDEGAFVRRSSRLLPTLIEAMRRGAECLHERAGAMILRRGGEHGPVIIAACGVAEDSLVAGRVYTEFEHLSWTDDLPGEDHVKATYGLGWLGLRSA